MQMVSLQSIEVEYRAVLVMFWCCEVYYLIWLSEVCRGGPLASAIVILHRCTSVELQGRVMSLNFKDFRTMLGMGWPNPGLPMGLTQG